MARWALLTMVAYPFTFNKNYYIWLQLLAT